MKKFKIILFAVFLLLFLIIILWNTQSLKMDFILFDFSLPRALWLFLAFMFGFIAGLLAAIRFERKPEKKSETESGREKS